MKKTLLLLTVSLLAVSAFGQEEKKEVKHTIQKEINVEEENGEKVVTIVTEENGTKTEEVYKGEAAEEKLAELENQHAEIQVIEVEEEIEQNVQKEVTMEEVNGEKVLTIKTIKDGKEEVEVLKGEAAEQRMKQMNSETHKHKEGKPHKMMIKEEKIIKKERM